MNRLKLMHGDCLKRLKEIPDNSVDMILTDLPYGVTACKWDNVIPFEPMWEQVWRVLKLNGACTLFGSEPFSSTLRMSQIINFKYDWIWKKSSAANHFNAQKQPMRIYEIISCFYRKQPSYHPQGLIPAMIDNSRPNHKQRKHEVYGNAKNPKISQFTNYPNDIIEFSKGNRKSFHPTQKPVALLEYLIKTYTLEGEAVLDFTMGSGSTGVAALSLGRKFIGIEIERQYFDIAKKRIKDVS